MWGAGAGARPILLVTRRGGADPASALVPRGPRASEVSGMATEHVIVVAALVALNMYAVACCLRNGRGRGSAGHE